MHIEAFPPGWVDVSSIQDITRSNNRGRSTFYETIVSFSTVELARCQHSHRTRVAATHTHTKTEETFVRPKKKQKLLCVSLFYCIETRERKCGYCFRNPLKATLQIPKQGQKHVSSILAENGGKSMPIDAVLLIDFARRREFYCSFFAGFANPARDFKRRKYRSDRIHLFDILPVSLLVD